MSLKELTSDKHREAEQQPFLKTIFAVNVDKKQYVDYLYQLAIIYTVLENPLDEKFSLFEGLENLKRLPGITLDLQELLEHEVTVRQATMDYFNYLVHLQDKKKAFAHVYVRHMGDLFGGQALAKLVPG